MEGRATALVENGMNEPPDRLVPDEESERFVFVWRPGVELSEEKRGNARRRQTDTEPEGAERGVAWTADGWHRMRVSACLPRESWHFGVESANHVRSADTIRRVMPAYDYRCPNGHTFELFQRMSDPPPSACEVCGASPVERVLYAPAVHFKGSGFYSTDYGSGKKRENGDGDGGGKTEPKKKEEKTSSPASTASSDSSTSSSDGSKNSSSDT